MGFSGDFAGLRKVAASMRRLASGGYEERNQVLGGAKGEIRKLLREQFEKSIGPDGEALQKTVRGYPALISKKLPNAFQGRVDQGALRFIAKTTRDMLRAQDEGHTFAARKVAANKHYLTFDKWGRLVKNRKGFNAKKGVLRSGYSQIYARGHVVGQRVLPARPIRPQGADLPSRYQAAMGRAMTAGIERWGKNLGAK